jgi:hypothetical protein
MSPQVSWKVADALKEASTVEPDSNEESRITALNRKGMPSTLPTVSTGSNAKGSPTI